MKLEFEDGALRPIGPEEVETARALADRSERHRSIVRYHEHDERVQRMLNAIEPDSYVRPHRHATPSKVEVFVALRGRAVVCTFDGAGDVAQTIEVAAGGPCHGVEIPSGTWHTLFALEPGTVLYEVIEGPFSAATHKEFAPWAPAEDSPEGRRYHRSLRRQLGYRAD